MDVGFLNNLRVNFLYADKYTFGRTWVYPESTIPYHMLRFILSGRAVFMINGEESTVQSDQVVYIPEGCRLFCRALDDNFLFISIRFNLSVRLQNVDILTEYFGFQRIVSCGEDRNTVLGYFNEVLRGALVKSPGRNFQINGNLELILAYLSNHQTQMPYAGEIPVSTYSKEDIIRRAEKSNVKQDVRIQVVIDYLVMNHTKNLQMSMLCEIANMSETSLRRNFKKHTGKTLGEFLKELRIITAARKLLVTDERISAIAYDLGFEDPNYFTRRFKSVFGVSPHEYRKTAQE